MKGGKPYIFISYSRTDALRVTPIVEALQDRGFETWRDQEHVVGAASWRNEIVEAIAGCSLVVVFVTRNSSRSENVSKELALANDERKPILPVDLEEVEPSGDLRYQIAGIQRIVWTADPDEAFARLCDALRRLVPGVPIPADPSREPTPGAAEEIATPAPRLRQLAGTLGSLAVIAVVCLLLALVGRRPLPSETRPPADAGTNRGTTPVTLWAADPRRITTTSNNPGPAPVAAVTGARTNSPRAEEVFPRLDGVWRIETTTAGAEYSAYRGLRVRYRVLVTQNGDQLTVSGEKTGEVNKGKASSSADGGRPPSSSQVIWRMPAKAGSVSNSRGKEGSTQREDFSTMFTLALESTNRLSGTFFSNAANAKGTVIWLAESFWRSRGWPNAPDSAAKR